MITQLNQYTWDELADMDPESVSYLLPISSLEQHGRHLPMGTDDFILQCVLKELAHRSEIQANILCLPILHYGNSHEHLAFRGVVSLSCQTIVSVVRDLLTCMKAHGIKRLVILNSHGGNSDLLNAYAQEWEAEFGIRIYAIHLWSASLFQGAELPVQTPLSLDIHAGEMETSILEYGMPEVVRNEKIDARFDTKIHLKSYYPGWNSADLSPENGVIGCASLATEEKGRQLISYIGDKISSYLVDI